MRSKIIPLIIALLLILSALASCSEDEPLPSGVSPLPDIASGELADTSGEFSWPADILPAGFPVPGYEKVYSVSREDNEVRIILFGNKKCRRHPSNYIKCIMFITFNRMFFYRHGQTLGLKKIMSIRYKLYAFMSSHNIIIFDF